MAPGINRILRIREAIRRTGISKSTILRLEKRGEFPRRVALSARTIGWREVDIEQWMNSRAEAGSKGA